MILEGDCLEEMRFWLPDKCVQTCVTSPPYFGLRDYGHAGQIGLEKTPDEYVAKLVEVFREVRRVLRDDGTVWLNLGDSYNAYNANRGRSTSFQSATDNALPKLSSGHGLTTATLKNKDLIGIPWRVAFALQADGWYLRQDIIWHKPNPMPESVTDRCTKAHEYVFLLTKSPRYYFDSDAIKEPVSADMARRARAGHTRGQGKIDRSRNDSTTVRPTAIEGETRNRRSVWTVGTKPYRGAHFATFPPDLIEPCILAGSRPGDTVLDPFGGSGTTAAVAHKYGRRSILCELNPDYLPLIHERLQPHKEDPKGS
jgi:DNA modification methylase